jgi:hypothetical protein
VRELGLSPTPGGPRAPAANTARPRGSARLWALLLGCALAAASCQPASLPALVPLSSGSAEATRAAAPAAPPLLRGSALLAALPHRPDLQLERGELFWKTGSAPASVPQPAARHRVLEGRRGGDLWVEVGTSAVRVSWTLAEPAFADPLLDLEALVARARAAGIAPASLRLQYVPVLGALALVNRGVYVSASDILRREPAPALRPHSRATAERRRSELRQTLAAAQAELDGAPLSASTRGALQLLLTRLERSDEEQAPDPPPSLLRRLLRNGWLERVLPDLESAPALAAALRLVAEPSLAESYRGPDQQLDVLQDALGERVLRLRSPELTRYARALPAPAYLDAPELTLVVDLPAGAGLADDAAWTAARVFRGDLELALARPDGTFVADPERWRAAVSVEGPPLEQFLLAEALPPHVFLVSALGDPRALITRHGVLQPPRGSDAAGLERFLDAAARTLPDAAHLDLIGERLHAYTYDSPDSTRPELIGTAEISTDIHQTALDTLARATGGTLYGDCDDLSELYQAIATRQGRNAHMLGLPAHAAASWSEPRGGQWWTYVLQTGPPVAFPGATAQGSVDAAYAALAGSGSTSGDQLEILLRFAGENTRESYFLSHRIFADASYARTMIELQQDWHDWTLYQGTRKIAALVAGGDHSTASRIELAAFQSSSLRWEAAEQTYRSALASSQDRAERIYLRSQLVDIQFERGAAEQAGAEVRQVLAVELALDEADDREQHLAALIGLADQLASTDRDPELALEVLGGHAQPILDAREHWYRDAVEQMQLERFVRVAVRVLELTGRGKLRESAHWQGLSSLVGSWFSECAFEPSELATSPLSGYALLGDYYRALKPDALAAIRRSPGPTRADRAHARRDLERSPVALDLDWIAVSPQFWWGLLLEELEPDRQRRLDRALWLELAHRTRVARAHAAELELDRPELEHLERLSALVTALLRGRPQRLA